jgi:hypothetical protein
MYFPWHSLRNSWRTLRYWYCKEHKEPQGALCISPGVRCVTSAYIAIQTQSFFVIKKAPGNCRGSFGSSVLQRKAKPPELFLFNP